MNYAYAFYQLDWGIGILNRYIPSGLKESQLPLYSDIIPIQIQQQFVSIQSSQECLPRQLRLRKLAIDAIDISINITYPFRGDSIEHENTIHEMKVNPKIVGWTIIGEKWIEC
jgi:hypothetical protein